jgi:potassium-transporting ATPase potassium-binding subunit
MTVTGWIQILLYCLIIVALTPLLGAYMTRVFSGERTFLSPILRPVELAIYKLAGVNESSEQHAVTYTIGMLLFHAGGLLILYVLMRAQASLPFNPAEQSAVAPDLSFNTAVSFITNTNWQNYGGESTMSYLVQMLGLTHQNYLSAATGIVLAVALIRGFARHSVRTVGNFWVDVTRCTLYVLLPICVPYALFLIWQGMPQTLGAYVEATTLEGAKQTIAVGPVASQIAIKMLGTNGGGFFNANAAHPFENPTALSNFIQMISIFALGAALTNVFGRMIGDQRQGWAVLAVMGVLFVGGVIACYAAEAHGNDALNALGLTGGNMEGKETRFGIAASALFAVVTTAASCGAVNAMHDSFTALGADQHRARRDHRGRRRLRHVRHAAVRHSGDLRRWSDGGPHAGICRQEDRSQGSQNGNARHSGPAIDVSRVDRGGDAGAVRRGRHEQSGAARLHRGALRLYLANRQQRLSICRTERKHGFL